MSVNVTVLGTTIYEKRQEEKWQRLNHPEKLREIKLPAYLDLQAQAA